MSESTTTGLVDRLRADVDRLGAGERLPSTRELVAAHHVSPVTVSRALAALANEGLVVTRPGAGTFVADPPAPAPTIDYSWQTVALAERPITADGIEPITAALSEDDRIPLSVGYLHRSLMPTRLLAGAAARAARLSDVWEPAPFSGLPGLRAWFAQASGTGSEARDLTITSGGQSSLSAVLRALVPAGAPLLVESPTYPGALGVARAAGMRVVGVPTDRDGVIPELLAESFARTGATACLLQPTWQNPTGAVLAPERRAAVLEAASRAGAFIVEDDYARWLGHGGRGGRAPAPLIADDTEGRVVHIASLTKATSAGLRIGAITARGPVRERIRALRIVDDMFVARLPQETALELVSRAGWRRHLETLSAELGRRAVVATSAVARLLPGVTLGPRPTGGLNVWVSLPEELDDMAVARAASAAGVRVMPGRPFFAAEAPGPYLRLTLTAVASDAELEEGLARLAGAVPALSGAA